MSEPTSQPVSDTANTSAPVDASGMSLNANRQAPSMSTSEAQGAASALSGSSAQDDYNRPQLQTRPSNPRVGEVTEDQYGLRPRLIDRTNTPVSPLPPLDPQAQANQQAMQKHLSFVDRINAGAKKLAGPPQYDYKVAPDGTLIKTERPVSAKAAWLSLVMEMLAGMSSGMAEHGPGAVGRATVDSMNTVRQMQQEKKAANEQRMQQASQEYALKYQTLENNLRMRQLAVSLSDHDFAHNQAVADSMRPFYTQFLNAGMIIPGTEQGLSEDAFVKQFGAKATENNAIPVGVEYVRDPATGEEVKDANGVSKVQLKWAAIDPSKEIDVTPAMQERMRYWQLPGWTKQDGTPQVPQGNMVVRGTIALGGITQATQLDTAQKELSDYAKQTTGKPLDPNFLRDAISKGLVSRSDIMALERVEGGHPVDEAVTALQKDMPESAAKVRALYNSIYRLDKFAEDRAVRIAGEKNPNREPATPEDIAKFTAPSLKTDFPHLSTGQIRNFVERAHRKNLTGEDLDKIRREAGDAEDRAIKLIQSNDEHVGKGQEQMFKTGIDPYTGEHLSIKNAPDEFLVNSRTGNPIPKDMLSTLKPTQQESNRADFSRSVIHTLDNIDQLKKAGKLPNGPLSGMTAQALAKAGLGNKDAQEAIDFISFAQSAATGAHVGGRFSVEVLHKMSGLVSLNMGDSQFAGAEDAIRNVMQGYVDQGGRITVAEWKRLPDSDKRRMLGPGAAAGAKADGAEHGFN